MLIATGIDGLARRVRTERSALWSERSWWVTTIGCALVVTISFAGLNQRSETWLGAVAIASAIAGFGVLPASRARDGVVWALGLVLAGTLGHAPGLVRRPRRS